MDRPLTSEEILSHAGWMRSLARGLVADEARADDVVQEAFAAIAERRPPCPSSVGGWLRGLVVNLARRGRREETRRRRREEIAARPESLPPSQEEVLERAELQRMVVDCVLDLAEPYRAAIMARYFSDMSAAQIAARDGVPLATVRTRLQRGLERLRRTLDSRHGGDRGGWRAVLLPLAVAGLVPAAAGSATAAAPLSAGTAAAAGLPGAAASSAPKLVILGATLMTQKSIILASTAALLCLAAGLAVGRFTARLTPETARERFQLVDAARVEDLQARLQSAARDAASRTSQAQDEAAALRSRLSALEAELQAARADAAKASAPRAGVPLAIAFGEFAELPALKEANWPELAGVLKEWNRLALESLEKLEKGEAVGQELQSKISDETGKLSKFSLGLTGKIPTNAAFNGEYTHPLVVSNLTGAMLEAAGLPLSSEQLAAIGRLGNDYEREYREKQGTYSEATPALKKMLDEFELKHLFLDDLRSQLSPEQAAEVLAPELQDHIQHDLLSPGAAAFFLVKSQTYASAEAARAGFQKATVESLGLTAEQRTALEPAFEAWYQSVKPLLASRKPTHLSAPLDEVLLAGRAQEGLILRVLELPDLDPRTRKALLEPRQWTLPQVFEKEP